MKRVLITCMNEAGAIIRKAFGSTLRIRKKAPVSLVTEVDIAADRRIISIILKNFPDHGILTEESRPRIGLAPYRWIIDPLDGTNNFARGIPLWGISLGLLYQGTPVFGYTAFPPLNQSYYGFYPNHPDLRGPHGAFFNDKPIHPRSDEPEHNQFFTFNIRYVTLGLFFNV